ncbi:MAG: HEAT repeat domain-containing protein [Magnetococcales bacterium]|nr:HEAT repeat domain-containing protein [Magnetococcales bacterium]
MNNSTAAVLLLTMPGCGHCAASQQSLQQLLAEGVIASLECIDISHHPEWAERLAIRSVPYVLTGPFIFQGERPLSEWRYWLDVVRSEKGMAIYFDHLFSAGQRQLVEQIIRYQSVSIQAFADLLADTQVGINSRLGVGAVLEELSGTAVTADLVKPLGQLTQHEVALVRGDACYYLSLLGWPAEAVPYWQRCLVDPDPEVVEIARECLEELQNHDGVGAAR